MPHFRKLVGQRCYLSPLSADDAERSAAWDNDLAVTIPLGDEAYTPATAEATRRHLEAAPPDHSFAIVDLATDTLIGRCLLFAVDQVNGAAMLGIVIGERAYQGRGYGREALGLLLDYGFNLLNLHTIMLGVFEFNTRALRCYRALGFREIGRRRQARLLLGRRYDVVFMDLLAEEFSSPYVRTLLPAIAEPEAQ